MLSGSEPPRSDESRLCLTCRLGDVDKRVFPDEERGEVRIVADDESAATFPEPRDENVERIAAACGDWADMERRLMEEERLCLEVEGEVEASSPFERDGWEEPSALKRICWAFNSISYSRMEVDSPPCRIVAGLWR